MRWEQSPLIDLVHVDISFPWMAITGGSLWNLDMPCFSHLWQPILVSCLTQVGQRDCGCSHFICVEALAKSVLLISFQFSHYCMFKLCWSSCFGSIQRKGLKRWMRFEKKNSFYVVYLPENVENNGSELTEQLMRLEQTAHMLVFCRQTLALKAIYLSLDGLGSNVMGALWRKMKHHTLKHEDKWRTWSCRLCGCGCVLSLLESSRPKRILSFVHVLFTYCL